MRNILKQQNRKAGAYVTFIDFSKGFGKRYIAALLNRQAIRKGSQGKSSETHK